MKELKCWKRIHNKKNLIAFDRKDSKDMHKIVSIIPKPDGFYNLYIKHTSLKDVGSKLEMLKSANKYMEENNKC